MGYVVKKRSVKINGVYVNRTRPDGSLAWALVYENRSDNRPEGTPREQFIPKDKYESLGFDERSTFEDAKGRAQQLNSVENLRKKNERARAKAIADQNHEELVQSALLPVLLVAEFKEKVLLRRFAENEKQARYQKLLFHWNFTQRMIAHLEIEPKDYADESAVFYNYLAEKEISPSYAKKIFRILNAWGQFYAKAMGAWGIQEVKNPRGKKREKIARANQDKEDYKGPANGLSPERLESKTVKMQLQQADYNWLYLSVWLGLRPEEIDNLKKSDLYRFELHDDGTTTILWVFQTKLTSVERSKAWKPIPLILAEQVKCIEIIQSGNFKRPLYKTLKNVFGDKRVTCYSGRKGFTDLMLSKGQELTDVTVWLGHTSIETTWRYYKSKQAVKFKKAG